MLKIRSEQNEQLRAYALEQYVARTHEQLARHFPRHCEISGEDATKNMIRLGVERAKGYGITGERHVVLYTSLMLLFGSFFDEDPQCAWARPTLKAEGPEAERAESLYDAGVQAWEKAAGEDNVNVVKALGRIKSLTYEELSRTTGLRDLLERVFPDKVARLPERAVEELRRRARVTVSREKLAGEADETLIGALMFSFGTGFDRDPMYPWAGDALRSKEVEAAERGPALFKRARAHAQAWLDHIEAESA